jgi:hypothetical protein
MSHLVLTLRVGTHFPTLCVVLITTFLSLTNQANAQTLLRWKLKPNESLHVAIEQHTDSTVSFTGKSAATKIDLTLVLGWNILTADDAGFRIRQTIERIHQKLTTVQSGTIGFDSASSAKLTGQSRDLADSLRPLVGAEFEMTMTPRGEITAVQPANNSAKALMAALETNPDGDATAKATTAKSTVEQMLRRPLLVLSDKPVAANESWSVSSQRPTAAGPLTINTTYTLNKLSDQNGKPIANINISAAFTPAPGGQLTIKEPFHSGQIQFNVADGRLIEIKQQQKLTTQRPYRETTITVTLDSTQTTTMATR